MTHNQRMQAMIDNILRLQDTAEPKLVAAAKLRVATAAIAEIERRGFQFLPMASACVECAKVGETITYGELCKIADAAGRSWGKARHGLAASLSDLTAWFWANDMPLFTVMVVNAATGSAGDGFKTASIEVGAATDEDTVDACIQRATSAIDAYEWDV